MVKGKKIREKGKFKLSQFFKKINDNISVSIVINKSFRASFPKRLNGKSGKTVGTRGKFKLVVIKEGNKTKTFIIHPIHLKKL